MNYISTLKLLSLVAVFALTGCSDPDSNFAAAPAAHRSTSAPQAAVHSVGYGGSGQMLSSVGGPYVRSIQRAGGVVIKRGQILRIVLPYSRFFISDDANHIKVAQRPALLAIAKLLNNRYPSAPIRVIGYTDSSGTYSQQVARGRQTGGVVTLICGIIMLAHKE